jgi:hypothetical protein
MRKTRSTWDDGMMTIPTFWAIWDDQNGAARSPALAHGAGLAGVSVEVDGAANERDSDRSWLLAG